MVVLFGEKAGLAIDAALDVVQRGFGELDAGATEHVSGLESQLMLTPFVDHMFLCWRHSKPPIAEHYFQRQRQDWHMRLLPTEIVGTHSVYRSLFTSQVLDFLREVSHSASKTRFLCQPELISTAR